MKVLVLAGGLGRRLVEVVRDIPKPMALIRGRPFLEFLILKSRLHGFLHIILCIGYLGEQVRKYFGNGNRWGVHIEYSHEPEPLGTGGAIRLAAGRLGDEPDFLVMNADSFLDVDLEALTVYHQRRNASATIALTQVQDASRFGRVEVIPDGKIVRFVEKGNALAGWINGGVYVLNHEILREIPNGVTSLEHDIFPKLVGKEFYGMEVSGLFIDIGTPQGFQRAQEIHKQLDALIRLC